MLYAAFMDLEIASDKTDREAFWSGLKIYGLGGIKAFYEETKCKFESGGGGQ